MGRQVLVVAHLDEEVGGVPDIHSLIRIVTTLTDCEHFYLARIDH